MCWISHVFHISHTKHIYCVAFVMITNQNWFSSFLFPFFDVIFSLSLSHSVFTTVRCFCLLNVAIIYEAERKSIFYEHWMWRKVKFDMEWRLLLSTFIRWTKNNIFALLLLVVVIKGEKNSHVIAWSD